MKLRLTADVTDETDELLVLPHLLLQCRRRVRDA
jgi:hypothetical protein